MFSYSCPSCSQRLLAPSEKAGTKTICPKCLKPLTVPAHDRMAAIDLEAVIEPVHAEVYTSSASDSLASDTGIASGGFTPAPVESFTPPPAAEPFTPVEPFTPAATDIDLDREERESEQTASTAAASVETAPPAVCVRALTPPPMPTAAVYRRKTTGDLRGAVNLTPTGMFSVDMAATLSATLSMRMQAPPEANPDRRIATAAWAAVSLGAVAIWVAAVFVQPQWFVCVAVLGAALVGFGYLWRAYLAGRNGRPLSGLAVLLPPVNAVAMLKPTEDHGHRPLRFVLAGVALLALFVFGPDAHTAAAAFRRAAPAGGVQPPASLAGTMHDLADREKDELLLRYVRELPTSFAYRAAGAEERAEAAAELARLARSPRGDLRETAFLTLLECAPDEARKAVLTALRDGPDAGQALAFADRVRSPEVAAAVVAKLADKALAGPAEAAVRKLGDLAEPALIGQLWVEGTDLTASRLLGQVGTVNAVKPLQRLAETTGRPEVKDAATKALKQLKDREVVATPTERVSAAEPAKVEPVVERSAYAAGIRKGSCTP